MEFDVTGLVDTMDVSERCRNAEVGANRVEGTVYVPDILGLGVERRVVNTGVVHAVLFTASDTDLHFEPEAKRRHALEVVHAFFDVLLLRLLRKIQHVGGEEGFAVFLEVFLVCLEHTVKPWEKLFSAVIGVEDDGATDETR